ncbi:branched-chain amino acid ABC transporter permease [Rhodospirillum rubrum]|uniref:branched-chain amino acid ABC transporter permease n=1 Tax=Rhodospirillum rubrum TaxID=1085 RepID=UPI0019070DAD|nr:branched-chain amino acid ABC transporter permease [Rhodospirillum rubrum]MBK1663478.1 branched-chain amino acid ABC transporter permease [Rhodospirillum rubrum]MBK1675676.1 branched-chain amino acid ABC transporter permease [Rhodospirillum rubrum]
MSRRLVLMLGGACLLALAGWGLPMVVSDYGQRLLIMGCISVILVASMGLANGFTGVFSLGQVGFVAIGAYVSGILSLSVADKAAYLPDLPAFLAGVQMGTVPATLIAGAVCAGVAVIVGLPLMRLSGHHVSVATMGFMIIVNSVIVNADSFTRGARTFTGVPTDITLPVALIWTVVTLALLGRLIYSPIGLALRSVREDTIAAQAVGLSVLKTRLLAFTVGAFFAGVGGSLYGHYLGSFSAQTFFFPLMVSLIIMLVLGGMGSLSGAVVGVVVVTALSEILRNLERGMDLGVVVVPPLFGASQVVLGLLFILVMIYRPRGLLEDRELTSFGRKG